MSRICFVTSSLVGPTLNGGVGTAMYYQALLLARENYDVTILFNGNFQVENYIYWKKKYAELNIKLVYLNNEIVDYQKSIDKHNWWVWRSYYVMKWLENNNFDIVHFAETCGYAFHTLQAKRTLNKFERTQIVVTMHSPTQWIYEGEKRWPIEQGESDRNANLFLKLNYAERYVCKHADLLLAPSLNMFEWAVNNGWDLTENRKMLFNPYIGPTSTSFGPIDYNHLIFFGTLDKRKGIDFFCEAIKLYCEAREDNGKIKVSFLGRNSVVNDMSSNDYIYYILRDSSIDIEIHNDFDTFKANEYIKKTHGIAILSSNQDNSPYSIVECIENKIPFICSRTGGIPELVDERVLFDPDSQGLYEKFMDLKNLDWNKLEHKYNAMISNEKILSLNRQLLSFPYKLKEIGNNVKPKVSICLSYYNHGKYIFGFLSSILNSSYQNYEIILIDDGSNEEGSKQAFEFLEEKYKEDIRFKFKKIHRSSKGTAYNYCAKMASGEYLLFVDLETIVKPEMIEKLVFGIQTSNSNAVSCHTQNILGVGMPTLMNVDNTLNIPIGASLELGMLENCFAKALVMIEKKTFSELGGMVEEKTPIPEILYLIKMLQNNYLLEVVPETLAWSRVISEDNKCSYNNVSSYECNLKIINTYFEDKNMYMKYFMQNWAMARYETDYIATKKLQDNKGFNEVASSISKDKQLLQQEKADLDKKIKDLSAELRMLTQKNFKLEEERKIIQLQGEQLLQTAINNYENSTSWKLTAPLRSLADLIRGKK